MFSRLSLDTSAGASTPTFSPHARELDYLAIEGVPATELSQRSGSAAALTLTSVGAATGLKAKAKAPAIEYKGWKLEKPAAKGGKKDKKKHPHSKKLGRVVHAEKGKKFNARDKVNGWLDGCVEPDPDE